MNRKKKLLCISAISFLFWTMAILLGDLRYSTNDDTIMNLIAAGAFGKDGQFLIFSNIVLGNFFKIMYIVIPGINWYLWFYLVLNLVSVIIIAHILTYDYPSIALTVFVTVVMNFFLIEEFYLDIQFTKNAAIYAIAGEMLLLHLVYRDLNKIPLWILGSLLIVAGFCARDMGACMTAPFLLGAIVFAPKILSLKKKRLITTFALPLALCLVCLGLNFYSYDMHADWKEYKDWDSIMTLKRDYGNYNFNWDKDEYLAAGFTENDFQLLDNWMWNDTEYFSLEKLQTMKAIGDDHRQDTLRLDKAVLDDAIGKFAASFGISPIPYVFMFVFLVTMILLKARYKLLAGYSLVVISAMYYVLTCIKRVEWRVECGIWLSGLLFILFFYVSELYGLYNKSTLIKENARLKVLNELLSYMLALLLFMMALYPNVEYFLNEKNGKIVKEDDWAYNNAQLLTKRDGFYIVSMNTLYGGLCGAKNIFDIDRSYLDYYHNIGFVGGWIVPSPIGNYHAYAYGISNPFKALAERDDVFYVGGGETAGYIYVFLNDKYGPGITMELEDDTEAGSIWRYTKNN